MAVSVTENLINYLVSKKSFALGYPMQAAKIVQSTDYFLTSCLGSTLKLIAIIDCDRHPEKRAIFSIAEINTLKLALKQFSYDAYGKRLGVSIEIWYVGNNTSSLLKEPTVQSMDVTAHQFWLSAWAFDIKANEVTCNSLSIRNFLRRRVLASEFRNILKKESICKDLQSNLVFY